jgi:DNA-binding transcriptional regulator YiaG
MFRRTLSASLIFNLSKFKIRPFAMPRKRQATDERDKVVERLREFIRFGYVTGSEVARRIGVNDTVVYSWLQGECRPSNPERLTTFLDSIPSESGSGIAPTGYEYREYKNWRGIPKPRRCPFCKRAKGEVRGIITGCECVSLF